MNEDGIISGAQVPAGMAADIDDQGGEIRETDIVFDCPHCGHGLVIDYRGAGLEIKCSACEKPVLVPIPDGMQLGDLDLDSGEILRQLFATRRNYQRAELEIRKLKTCLVQLKTALGAMETAVDEGLGEA